MSEAAPKPSFWKRRIATPVISLLKQGMTPEKLAQTFGAGFVCSMFPILGTTSVLNLAVGLRFRLNHPLMQTLNQVLAPLHLVMIIGYIRFGEWIWRAHDDPITIADIVDTFREASWREFFDQFGWAIIHATTAWIITAPFFYFLIYFPIRRLFRFVIKRRHITPPPAIGE